VFKAFEPRFSRLVMFAGWVLGMIWIVARGLSKWIEDTK